MRKLLVVPIALTLLVSCHSNRFDKIDTSSIDLKVQARRFEIDLFSLNPDSLSIQYPKLEAEYGNFARMFTEGIIRIGNPNTPDFYLSLKRFVTDTMVHNAYVKSELLFSNFGQINEILTEAFKRYKYYFPNKPVPQIFTFVSGYNLSLAVDDSILAVGLDRYRGAKTVEYRLMGIPLYQQRKMIPEKIPSDLMRAWMYAAFEFNDSIDNLLSNIIYEGEVMYLTKRMLSNQTDSLIFGFTPNEYKWCVNNERPMWTSLIENKMLFSTNTSDINKLINDAPFTSGFPQESPGRAAVWLGYRIVNRFMNRNDTLTLAQLMQIKDYTNILREARYNP